MTREILNKIWDRFLHNLGVHSFSEKEMIMEGKKIKNFLGSAELHKRIFMESAQQILVEQELGEDNGHEG